MTTNKPFKDILTLNGAEEGSETATGKREEGTREVANGIEVKKYTVETEATLPVYGEESLVSGFILEAKSECISQAKLQIRL